MGSVGLFGTEIELNYHCPQSSKLISQPTNTKRKAGDPINYVCPDHKIEWETGLKEGSADT
jgi:hypothetical protein